MERRGVPLEPRRILETLQSHGVEAIVVGGVAARLQGWPVATTDVDIAARQTSQNLGRLAAPLKELDARLVVGRDETVWIPLDEKAFTSPVMRFETLHGDIDVVGGVSARGGFEELSANAVAVDLEDGLVVNIASLDDVSASKESADRPKGRGHLPTLYELREVLTEREVEEDLKDQVRRSWEEQRQRDERER